MSAAPDMASSSSLLLGAFGWLVTVVVSYRLGQHKSAEDRYWAAAAAFRGAVNAAVFGIPRTVEQSESAEAANRFYAAHRALEVAVANFRPFVKSFDQPEFELAWTQLSLACERNAHALDWRQRQGLGMLTPAAYRDCRVEVTECAESILAVAPEKRLMR